MKYTKSHDGTITATMSPDEASILALAMSRGVCVMGSAVTTERAIDLRDSFEDASHAEPTDAHLLFNQLHAQLHDEATHLTEDFKEGEGALIYEYAKLIDHVHHLYADLKQEVEDTTTENANRHGSASR